MSLKCSVFGCDYGDPEVTREREEDGSEVIITIRETETCTRCGEQRVVSENKEVTTLQTAADIVADDLADEPGEDDTGPTTDESPVEEAPETAIPDAETGTALEGGEPSVEGVAPEEDDAVILDEESADSTEREPGEWPEEPPDEEEWEQPTSLERDGELQGDFDSGSDAVGVTEDSFYCEECGFTAPVSQSSHREGDFCPECHTGALAVQDGE